MKRVYADHAATTPMLPCAKAAMVKCIDESFGNPSSTHYFGQAAAVELQKARKILAECLGCSPADVIFTSGGTEADNQVIQSAAYWGLAHGKNRILTSAIEHHAVLNALGALSQSIETVLLPVDQNGVLLPETLEAAIDEKTALVSVMFANNEIGTIEPIAALGSICRKHNVFFHTDAVQAVGHIPINIRALPIDALSLSAHKFGGARGVGALIIPARRFPVRPLIFGGAQEHSLRAGTENLPAIVSMAAALQESCSKMGDSIAAISKLRDTLDEDLRAHLPEITINAASAVRLPGILSICFPKKRGDTMLMLLDMKGIAVSTGAACSSQSSNVSHVLRAIGLSEAMARSTLRISLSSDNTEDDIHCICDAIMQSVSYKY